MRHLPESGYFWLALASAVLLVGVVLTIGFWGWLHPEASTTASNSETLRNVGLLVGGALAFVFAGWRAWVAEQEKVTAQCQAETADRRLLNEGYQKAAEMLGSNVLAVRLGGIYALRVLAEQHPEQYHVQVMRLLCSFVRHPIEVAGQPTVESIEFELGAAYGASTAQAYASAGSIPIESVREDIHVAMSSIASCHAANLQIETFQNYWLDLRSADLRGIDLGGRDLSRASVDPEALASRSYPTRGSWYTNMRKTKLHCTSFRGTNLTHVDLSFCDGPNSIWAQTKPGLTQICPPDWIMHLMPTPARH